MTVTHDNVGTAFATGTTTATATGTSWPAGTGGGLLFLVAYANSLEQTPTPADGDVVEIATPTAHYGGDPTTPAIDVGRRGAAAFFTPDGSKTAQQFTQPAGTGGAVLSIGVIRVQKSLAYWGVHKAVAAFDTASGSTFSATASTNPGSASGDMVYVMGATIPFTTSIGYSLVWTGSGLTSLTSTRTGNNGGGYKIRHNIYRGAPTGVASANPTINGTQDQMGTAILVRLLDTSTAPAPWRRRASGVWVPRSPLRRQSGTWVAT